VKVPDLPFEPRDDWERAQELCYQAFDSQGRRACCWRAGR